jgi:hypothetical protein
MSPAVQGVVAGLDSLILYFRHDFCGRGRCGGTLLYWTFLKRSPTVEGNVTGLGDLDLWNLSVNLLVEGDVARLGSLNLLVEVSSAVCIGVCGRTCCMESSYRNKSCSRGRCGRT